MAKTTMCSNLCSRHNVDMHPATSALYLVQYCNASLKSPDPSIPPVTSRAHRKQMAVEKPLFGYLD